MSLKQTLDAYEALDSARASGRTVEQLLSAYPAVGVSVAEVHGAKGKTDFVKVVIGGTDGRARGGTARTLGIVGRLGGLGARPQRIASSRTATARSPPSPPRSRSRECRPR